MFDFLRKFLIVPLGVIALVVVALLLTQEFISQLETYDESLAAAILAGVVTIIVALSTSIINYFKDQNKSMAEAHRGRKVEIYSNFSNIVFDLMKKVRNPDSVENIDQNQQLMNRMWKLKEGILFYGSPEVIKTFNHWMKSQDDGKALPPKVVLKNIGQVFLAMRKDLGLSNMGLNSLNIHQIYMTDDLGK